MSGASNGTINSSSSSSSSSSFSRAGGNNGSGGSDGGMGRGRLYDRDRRNGDAHNDSDNAAAAAVYPSQTGNSAWLKICPLFAAEVPPTNEPNS